MLPIPRRIPPETPGFNLVVSPGGGGSCSLPAPSLPTNPLRQLEEEGAIPRSAFCSIYKRTGDSSHSGPWWNSAFRVLVE